MQLFLTSNGLSTEKLKNSFRELLNRSIGEVSVLVAHSAKTKEQLVFLDFVKTELLEIGLLEKNISFFSLVEEKKFLENINYDVIYICGGNTFTILNGMKKSGIFSKIKSEENSSKIYVGVSAGTIIASPEISIASYGSLGDVNEINLKDLSGLNFTKSTFYPHYSSDLRLEIENFEKLNNIKLVSLKDGEAFLQIKNKTQIIS